MLACAVHGRDPKRRRGRFHYLRDVAREVLSTWLGVIEAGACSGAFRDEVDTRVFYRFVRDAAVARAALTWPLVAPGTTRLLLLPPAERRRPV